MARSLNALGYLSVVALTATFTLASVPAWADSIKLVRPSQAQSLTSGGVGMTVYYLGNGSPLEIVAIFGDRESVRPISQLRMSLADGDDIEFIIPRRPEISFRFVRSGSLIEVHSNPVRPSRAATN